MVLNILVLLLLAAIAYFHFAQGLFAATVSAICAGVAALMAFSYHEAIVTGVAGDTAAGYSNAGVLCGVFALIYLILRIILDNMFPGNVRYPVVLDRIGSAVMGVTAGFFATAIITIAAQELPFGPQVAMYSPYPVETVDWDVPRDLSRTYKLESGQGVVNRSQIQLSRLDLPDAREQRQELWVPVDAWFLGLVSMLSDKGALAGNRFRDIYPDFKTALYGHRIGIQRAANQAALNKGSKTDVSVSKAFRVTTDGQAAQFPGGIPQVPGDIEPGRRSEPSLTAGPGKTLLVIRLAFGAGAADKGGLVRFSPGTARLVIAGNQYYPLATLESGRVAVAHKPDDYLLASSGADLIYEVDSGVLVNETGFATPAFLEFKRFARVDLSEHQIYSVVTQSPNTHMLRKLATMQLISARIATPQRTERTLQVNEFHQLRGSVPQQEPDAEAAERAARGEPDPSEEQPQNPQGAGQDSGAEGGGSAGEGGMLDQIQQERQRQNEAAGDGEA